MSSFVIHNFEQRSPEWYKIREGRITGTSIASCLGKSTLATTVKSIDSLALKLATESLIGVIEDDYVSFDMQRGIDQEPMAFEAFKSLKATEFIDVKNVGFVSQGFNIGFSPDGILSNDEGLEIKCPNPANYFKVVAKDFIDDKHYAQMQFGMFITGFKKWHYVNYLLHMGKEYMHVIEVERDEDMILLMAERVNEIITAKANYIDILNNKIKTI